MTNEFKFNSGEDSQAKWDVFAECLVKLPIEEQNRFVDYSQIECERFTDLADETDTLATESTVASQLPAELASEHL